MQNSIFCISFKRSGALPYIFLYGRIVKLSSFFISYRIHFPYMQNRTETDCRIITRRERVFMEKKNFVLDYIDSLMIVNKDMYISFAERMSVEKTPEMQKRNDYELYIGRHFFDVYTDLEVSESSLVECLKKGEVIFREKQNFKDYMGNVFVTNNITYPIKRHGQVVGAIELSQDITSVGDLRKNGKSDTRRKFTEREISRGRTSWNDIITQNPELLGCIETAKIFAQSSDPVMLYGETGTGKELFVEAMVNENLERRDKYVVQNCAAIPENLFESILFGSTRGAFTGAENKKGLFEIADGGILFLDELNSMPLHLQPKLLRVMQDGKIRPIGSRTEKKVDVKVIVAMNKPPMELIQSHQLREDLFYRLSSGMINLIPLRQRKEDIPLYIKHFLAEFNQKYHKNVKGISEDMKENLLQYDWPGNVRELKNVLDLSIKISNEDILTSNDLPLYMKEAYRHSLDAQPADSSPGQRSVLTRRTLREVVEAAEKDCIKNALVYCDGNVTRAAEMLGLPRQTLKFRMDKLNIQKPKKK